MKQLIAIDEMVMGKTRQLQQMVRMDDYLATGTLRQTLAKYDFVSMGRESATAE
jgi:hypothetical protein